MICHSKEAMSLSVQNNPNLIRTPVKNIPVIEVVPGTAGQKVRVKKPRSDKEEILSTMQYVALIVNGAAEIAKAETPNVRDSQF